MKISYQTTKLEKLLHNSVSLKKKYGEQVAAKIVQCVQDLDASDCLRDVPRRLRAHPREPKQNEVFQVDVLKHKHPTRLLFKPLGDYEINDYATITSIELIEIVKTHS